MSFDACAAPLWFFLLALLPVILIGFYLGRFWHSFTYLYSPRSLRQETEELVPLYRASHAEHYRSDATQPSPIGCL